MVGRTWRRLSPSLQFLASRFSPLGDISVPMLLVIIYFFILSEFLKPNVV